MLMHVTCSFVFILMPFLVVPQFPAYLEVRELVRAVVETHKNELIKAARDRKKKSYIDAFW